jgi:hypothetical protein
MRDMVYNLPVLTPPRWVRSRTTPVALENLLVDLVEPPTIIPARSSVTGTPDSRRRSPVT